MVWKNDQWKKWRLVAKLDPDKTLPSQALEIIRDKNIDAVMVGGTQGINYTNTQRLVQLIRESGFEGPLVQEISTEDAVITGVDAHFIPVVLNSGDVRWLSGAHLGAIKKYGQLIRWDKVLVEGYLVCNHHSAVGQITGVSRVSIEDALAYTVLAEEIYRMPLLYLEYSGVFGDLELIGAVAEACKNIHLFYGGGVKTPEQLKQVASLVDTVVIGNVFYDNPAQAADLVKSCR